MKYYGSGEVEVLCC